MVEKENVRLLFDPKSTAPQEAQQHTLEKGEWSGEHRQVTKTGQEVIVQSHWTLMSDAAGLPKSILIINTDITEKKKLEAQSLRAQRMETLGTLAGGIANDLNNVLTPILMAGRMLREEMPKESCQHLLAAVEASAKHGADIVKQVLVMEGNSTLAGSVAQDLHNVLTPILVAVRKLRDEMPKDTSQQLLATMETSAKRGSDLVKQVMTFAQGAEGVHILLQVPELLQETEKAVRNTFPQNIQLQSALVPDLALVMGDSNQLQQVLLNLCQNARDAMPQGGRLTLANNAVLLTESDLPKMPEAKPGSYVRLTVADTGSGIAPEIMDKIFDPFFTTKPPDKAAGLGLSTALGIVRSHGGFIQVQSEVDRGSRFEVYLPAAPKPELADAGAEACELPQGKGELILVVDDEASVCEVTKIILEKHGYRVMAAEGGSEAVALFAQHRDDIKAVLTDMAMPFMDGPATIRALRRIDPEIKIIVASGLDSDAFDDELPGLKAEAVLTKPYMGEKLLATLSRVLKGETIVEE
jgi:signal transduction histidine kinase/ActR/RegA family two-component response regulator